MPSVTGIGGVFLRARDPKVLAEWYETHLGVTNLWQQQAGLTVFAPFEADSDYFPADRQWMINFRVSDLAGLIRGLREKGVAVETRAEWDASPEVGRFARISDPEGNPIELWEPASEGGPE